MVTLEEEHPLLWEVDQRFTTTVGRCACEWRCWSRHKDEVRAAYQVHLEFVKRRQAEAEKNLWELEARLHVCTWNENRDGARCERAGCRWACFTTSTAAIYVSWNAHLEGLKTHAV